jgi:hypothetical protein
MVAFCYCLSFAFDKAQASYGVVSNLLSFAVLIPLLIVITGSLIGS